ncbi:hypothetical protein [Streptomyces sp. GSL17-111]|uniref:hypothetical protein n=1 Tax=Streptomyces sp. GSL17-111 TaxID=3121596 RepID=UPI0030F41710
MLLATVSDTFAEDIGTGMGYGASETSVASESVFASSPARRRGRRETLKSFVRCHAFR